VDTQKSSASSAQPAEPTASEEQTPHGCIAGVVYIGHLVADEHGEEVEVIEAVPCKRCLG
jgi:hypothetical protein